MRVPATPPKMTDILGCLDPDSVRRLSQDDYRECIADCQSSYRHWQTVQPICRQRGLDPEIVWLALKMGREQAARRTPFAGVDGRPICFSVPDVVRHELMLIDQQLAGQISLADEDTITHAERERFIVSALMEEAIASSLLEGAATTRRIAKEMLRTGRRPRDRSERMIVNNYATINRIRDDLDRPLTPDSLIELQATLTEGTLEDPGQVGRLRQPGESVVVSDEYGAILHTPPPPESLPDRMRVICDFANQSTPSWEGQFVHPVVRAVLLHFQVAYDHPFCDGNGRTARAVFYWSMLRRGYWLFEYLPISRLIYKSPAKYGRAFLYTETDDLDATYFLVYNARIISRARGELREYLRDKRRTLAQARLMLARDRSLNHRQHALLMHAMTHPDSIYTIQSHQNSHRVAYGTARSDLLRLVEEGYLIQRTVGSRYVFTPAPTMEELPGRPSRL